MKIGKMIMKTEWLKKIRTFFQRNEFYKKPIRLLKSTVVLYAVISSVYGETLPEKKQIGIVGSVGWTDLGKRFGYEIELILPKTFDSLEDIKKYEMIILGGGSSYFSETQYKNMEKYVEEGGILALLSYDACRYIDVNGNGKYDAEIDCANKNKWIFPRVTGVTSDGPYFLGEIRFQGNNPLAKGLSHEKTTYHLYFSAPRSRTRIAWRLNPQGEKVEIIGSAKLFERIKEGSNSLPGKEKGEGAILTCNKYGKGVCVQSGIFLEDGALMHKCPVCLQLVENIFSMSGITPSPEIKLAKQELCKEPEMETRGFWVNPYLYFDRKDEAKGKEQINEFMKKVDENNFNFIGVLIHRGNRACYNSNILPIRYFQWDPLAAIIEEAHKYGIEVFAWFLPDFHDHHAKVPGEVLERHPEWKNIKTDEKAQKSFAYYLRDMVMEVVNNYEIDGIIYDDETGRQEWNKFFYPLIYNELEQKHPEIIIGAYVFDITGYPGEGYVDVLFLEKTPSSISLYKDFYQKKYKQFDDNPPERKMLIYSDIHFVASSGRLETAQDMIDRIDASRRIGIEGISVFHHGGMKFQVDKIWPELHETVFCKKVLPAHVKLREKKIAERKERLSLIDIRGGQGKLVKADKSEIGEDDKEKKKKEPDAQLKIISLTANQHLVHYLDKENVNFSVKLKYDVLKPAPIYLTSEKDKGDEWYNWKLGYEPEWHLYNYSETTMPQLYAKEKIDLGEKGIHECNIPFYTSDKIRGGRVNKGVCGITGIYYSWYMLDKQNGKYLDTALLPVSKSKEEIWQNFNRIPELGHNLTFVIANLKKYELNFAEFKSDWEKGGFVTVRLQVTDGDGAVFDLPRAEIKAEIAGSDETKEIKLVQAFSREDVPQGYFQGQIPFAIKPDSIRIEAVIKIMNPSGKEEEKKISKVFEKSCGCASRINEPKVTLTGLEKTIPAERNAQGVLKETRLMYAWGEEIRSQDKIDMAIGKLKEANFNVFGPCFYPAPDGARLYGTKNSELLDYLVDKAHQAGIEVHPYMSMMGIGYLIRSYGKDLMVEYAAVKEDGTKDKWACCHRPDFRMILAQRIADAVKKHHLDGVNLDYSRTQDSRCYCDYCKDAFKKRFGKEITAADSCEWQQWQDEGMTECIQETYSKVKNANQQAIVHAYCVTPQKRGGQRGWKWANENYLDIALQSAYWVNTYMRIGYVANELGKVENKSRLYPVIGGHAAYLPRDTDTLLKEVSYMKQIGVKGLTFFTYILFTDEHFYLLKKGPFKEKAIPYFREESLY